MRGKERVLNTLKWTYKVVRSVILTAIILFAFIFTLIYIALSLPPVDNYIRERAQSELSAFLDSKVEIEDVSIRPFNEVQIENAHIFDQEGKECLMIGRLGAGINLWRLLSSGTIEITYVELLNFKADVYQTHPDKPLNIYFIIKAFAPKDKNKPPTRFDLNIHNIVVRGGEIRFDREWKPAKASGTFDASHIRVNDFSCDVAIPHLSNEHSVIDLRRLSFNEKSGFIVKGLGALVTVTPSEVTVKDFNLSLPESSLHISDFQIPLSFFNNHSAKKEPIEVKITESNVTPSNLSAFFNPLQGFDISFPLKADLKFNDEAADIMDFSLGSGESPFQIKLENAHLDYKDQASLLADVQELNLTVYPRMAEFVNAFVSDSNKAAMIANTLRNMGETKINIGGQYTGAEKELSVTSEIESMAALILIEASARFVSDNIDGTMDVHVPEAEISRILPQFPLKSISGAEITAKGHLPLKNLQNSDGEVNFNIGEIEFSNRRISAIAGSGNKSGNEINLSLDLDDSNLNGTIEASAELAGKDSRWSIDAEIRDFDTYSSFIDENAGSGFELSGKIKGEATGDNIDNLTGELLLDDLSLTAQTGKNLILPYFHLVVADDNEGNKSISIQSDIADVEIAGRFVPSLLPGMVKRSLGEIMPAFFSPYFGSADCGEGTFRIDVKDAKPLIEFFNLPIFPLTEMTVSGNFDSNGDRIETHTTIPYIQQGKDKLITDTYLDLFVIGEAGSLSLDAGTVYPTKKGLLKMDLDLDGENGVYDIEVYFNKNRNVAFDGRVDIRLFAQRNPITDALELSASFIPSEMHLNGALWNIEESEIIYTSNYVNVKDFCVRHDNQYVFISGYSDKTEDGMLEVLLSEIDLDYIFGTLNIPHVTFGGIVSGEISARGVFGPNPKIQTEKLVARDFSYNGATLGGADLRASLDLPKKMVNIGARVYENDKTVADVDGGVWFGRDSLSFNFKADGVNVAFMQPFMQAFSSEVKGRASGEAHLFGTFSDIDMTGVLVADNVEILIDYINARYSGSDTVYLYPGKIEIPGMTVTDKFGHTARVTGELSHRYFHDPVFRFQVTEMDQLLVYDTNAKINPLWYGTIFVSGNGEITGRPGSVRIAADVQTEPSSDFTFVLSDQQEALKSSFLTFSDRRKKAEEENMPKDTVPDFLLKFRKAHQEYAESSDIFTMDFRVSVTDDVKMNLVMDPAAGDKIIAYGTGAMNLIYSSLTDELRIYGKYTLDKGSYNFSLQDIILKEFTIKPGSSIAFTGDPYTGTLDITAAYRVNTSLTELDRSFANDRELNRTSVPVEAILKVTGVLTSPNIDFDIELPTVTEETAQKVRSIISTEDMMSRQVLYLVALNKFYPPEYMATSNSGGEWASIASSTLSSQIQNIIGQITDKFTLAPSIRSDKGDFSDLEVDLALSSQLFNNRLLINGNLGYRDPSNSSTTFVGDFDLEYLLNRKGTWRLKAYNHFNDQNYYLKSALTTQGLGIVWRKDFGLPPKSDKKKEDKKKEDDKKSEKDKMVNNKEENGKSED